ncbi:MAG: hypothetical protein WC979_02610 [Candidatus Pacearchaeota archaeon]|jgi:hypothetical protein|nr:hypothetical protein [Clostridia bacterium]
MKNRIPTFESFEFNDCTQLFELSNNSTLYHHSMAKFKVGDVITSQKNGDGVHWLANDPMEIGLEFFRKKHYPDRPSRFDCVYSSIIPRTRFSDKGYLYVVQPVGSLFMTDSMIIDSLGDEFMRERMTPYYETLTINDFKKNPEEAERILSYYSAKRYWDGVKSLPRERWGDIEVLSNSAIVTQVIEDSGTVLRPGMDVVVTEDNIIDVTMTIYNQHPKENDTQLFDNEQIATMLSYIEKHIINGKFEQQSYNKNVYDIRGYLRKDAKLKTTFIRTNLAKNVHTYDTVKGKYSLITFDLYIDGHLFKRANEAPLFRLETAMYLKNKAYDIGMYLKKV